MVEYLTLVVTASFFSTLIIELLGEKGSGKLAKVTVRLVMLAIVIFPITNALINFSGEIAIPVINNETLHNIDSEDADIKLYRQWLADTTAKELSNEIQASVKEGLGLDISVRCTWHFVGNDVVFDKIKVYTDADGAQFDKIQSYIKLHFSLESVKVAQ